MIYLKLRERGQCSGDLLFQG